MKNIAIGPEGGWSNNEKDKFKYLSNIGAFGYLAILIISYLRCPQSYFISRICSPAKNSQVIKITD